MNDREEVLHAISMVGRKFNDPLGLAVCPCGQIPQSLHISEDAKWAYVSPSCCDEWHVEFRTMYHKTNTKECMDLAIAAWNAAPRAK